MPGHPLGAALAHAHAVAVAPHDDRERLRRAGFVPGGFHRDQFVIRSVQPQGERALDLAVHVQCHVPGPVGQHPFLFHRLRGQGHAVRLRRRAGLCRRQGRSRRQGLQQLRPQREPQPFIHPAALEARVHRLNGFDGIQLPFPVAVALRGQLLAQRRLQHGLQRRAALAAGGDGQFVLQAARVLQVVGVVLHGQIAVVVGAAPDLAGQRGLPAVAGGVIADRVAAAVQAHHAAGGVHRRDHVGVLGVKALVHLVGRGVHQVVIPAGGLRFALHGVGARGHGLGLQRLDGEGIAHLVGHHAVQVVLHLDLQHRPQPAVRVRGHGQIAAVQRVLFRFIDVNPVFRAVGGPVPGKHGAAAQIDRQPPHGQVHAAVRRRKARPRAALEPKARIAVHGVDARERQIQLLRRAQRPQEHPQHAVVPQLAVGDLRRDERRRVRLGGRLRRGRGVHRQRHRGRSLHGLLVVVAEQPAQQPCGARRRGHQHPQRQRQRQYPVQFRGFHMSSMGGRRPPFCHLLPSMGRFFPVIQTNPPPAARSAAPARPASPSAPAARPSSAPALIPASRPPPRRPQREPPARTPPAPRPRA